MNNKNILENDSLEKLLRLQKVRIRSYEKKLAEDKRSYLEARDKLNQRNNEIDSIQNQHEDIKGYLSMQHVSNSPVKTEYAHIRRFWLNYDLEMHEYYRDQENIDHDDAKNKYETSKKEWLRERMKSNRLNNEFKAFAAKKNVIIENTQDEVSQEDYMQQHMGKPL